MATYGIEYAIAGFKANGGEIKTGKSYVINFEYENDLLTGSEGEYICEIGDVENPEKTLIEDWADYAKHDAEGDIYTVTSIAEI